MNLARNLSRLVLPRYRVATFCRTHILFAQLRSVEIPGVRKLNMQSEPVQRASTRLNRLANAKSPYLLQHTENPVCLPIAFVTHNKYLTHTVNKVDWYEWGTEAFDKAKREDRPIFLSVGYSACHCM